MEVSILKHFSPLYTLPTVDLTTRVNQVAQSLFHFIRLVCYATVPAANRSIRRFLYGLRYLVFSSYGITDVYFVTFRVAFWMFYIGRTFVEETFRIVVKEYFPENNKEYSPENNLIQLMELKGVDPRHLQLIETTLDASGVPNDIQVESLLKLFQEIEFEDESKPTYIPPSFYTAENKRYSKDELQKSLNTFVSKVSKRTFFTGTPPTNNEIKLMEFYQQIENAVRLSIQKTSENLTQFKNEHNLLSEDPDTRQQYKNLLEDQARLVIDLAISGNFCGARYLGEALTRYHYLYNESNHSDNLEESLNQLLGNTRKAVAQQQIQTHFRKEQGGIDVHYYNRYMQELGPCFAIPGTKNVFDYLESFHSFDKNYYAQHFLNEYSKTLEESVQEKIKSSQRFREQIIDWLKEQSDTWQPENGIDPAHIVKNLQGVIDDKNVDISDLNKLIQSFSNLLDLFKNKSVPLLPLTQNTDWKGFIQDLMMSDEAKQWFESNRDDLKDFGLTKKIKDWNKTELSKGRQSLIQELTNPLLEQVLRKCCSKATLPSPECLKNDLTKIAKIKQMHKILPGIDDQVLMRILNNETDLNDVVHDHVRITKQTEFLNALNLSNIHDEGLPPLILKWLLWAHHIIIPQPDELIDLEGPTISQEKLRLFLDQIGPERNTLPIENKNAALDQLFDQAFRENPKEVSLAAQKTLPSIRPFYPPWKQLFCIDIPKFGSRFFGNPLLKIASSIVVLISTYKCLKRGYAYNKVLTNKINIYLEKKSSTYIKVQSLFSNAYYWSLNNQMLICFAILIVRITLDPSNTLRGLRNSISPMEIMNIIVDTLDSYFFTFLLLKPLHTSFIYWNGLNQLSNSLKNLSNQSEQERDRISRKISYSLWRAQAGYS